MKTAKTNRLIALLRAGEDTDRRRLVRSSPLANLGRHIARRRPTPRATAPASRAPHRNPPARPGHPRRRPRAAKRTSPQLRRIVADLAPGLTRPPGHRSRSAPPQAIVVLLPPRARPQTRPPTPASPAPAPLQASSGRTMRHRLNRGGDRALNRALHDIAKHPHDPLPPPPATTSTRRRAARQDRPRDPPLPQALHRPRALPPAHPRHDPRRLTRRFTDQLTLSGPCRRWTGELIQPTTTPAPFATLTRRELL